jgi:hypothetical protein
LAKKLINIIESENVTYLGEKRELDNSHPDGEEMVLGKGRTRNGCSSACRYPMFFTRRYCEGIKK